MSKFRRNRFVLAVQKKVNFIKWETLTSVHKTEKAARNAMTDPGSSVIARISSEGIDTSLYPHAARRVNVNRSVGSSEAKVIHQGDRISTGLADSILKNALNLYGNMVRNEANKARKNSQNLASETAVRISA